jgi:methionyl-tRNA formyltransferase
MRIGFAGTPEFAAAALRAMLEAGKPIAVALAQPDRPRGRGMAIVPGAVSTLARTEGIPLLQPATLRTAEARAPLALIALDVLVVAAYGLIFPPEIL